MTRTHTAHAVVFGILSVSGILLLPAPFSDWRESLLGGYGQAVRDVHLWLVIPYTLLLVSTANTYALGALRRPSRSFKYFYKKINATISIPAALALLITGVILWARESLPFALTQAAREVHTVLTWVAVPWVALHGLVEGARYVRRLLSTRA